jgi:ABC-type uncharacterized transport system permease subunit
MIHIDRNPSPSKLRQFSFVLVLLSSYMILSFVREQSQVRAPANIASPALSAIWLLFALGSLGIIIPKIARIPFLALSYLTFPIGLTFSYVVLLAVYFLMIAPTGLWMRITGRDRMGLKHWKDKESRWSLRKKTSDPGYYLRQ